MYFQISFGSLKMYFRMNSCFSLISCKTACRNSSLNSEKWSIRTLIRHLNLYLLTVELASDLLVRFEGGAVDLFQEDLVQDIEDGLIGFVLLHGQLAFILSVGLLFGLIIGKLPETGCFFVRCPSSSHSFVP
jgi:hypothetical protein